MVEKKGRGRYSNMRLFLSEDKKMGFALDGDNIVSVFSRKPNGSNAMGKIIPFAVAAGGRRLDCFAGGLQHLYARYGARPTGKTHFDEQYAPPGWDGHSKPPIVAMRLPSSLKDVVKAYNPRAKVQLNKVRYYSNYDDMENSSAKRGAKNIIKSALRGALGSNG
jgi:hypothetical protein